MPDFIIDDSNFRHHIAPVVNAVQVHRGLVPRDFKANPAGCYGSSITWDPDDIETIPRSEWADRIRQMEQDKSRLSDLKTWDSLDQNGQGFCWAYSTTAGVMYLRAAANLPHVRLSPHAVACKIYNFRDRGAWGALSLDFISKNGVPSDEYWPQKSMNRQHDNAETWENAKQYRVTEGWMDLDVEAWDAELAFDQVATCLLNRQPVVTDFNWWGHSVIGVDLVMRKQDSQTPRGAIVHDGMEFGINIDNSWTPSWGDNGMAKLFGTKAIPDGACCPRVVMGE